MRLLLRSRAVYVVAASAMLALLLVFASYRPSGSSSKDLAAAANEIGSSPSTSATHEDMVGHGHECAGGSRGLDGKWTCDMGDAVMKSEWPFDAMASPTQQKAAGRLEAATVASLTPLLTTTRLGLPATRWIASTKQSTLLSGQPWSIGWSSNFTAESLPT